MTTLSSTDAPAGRVSNASSNSAPGTIGKTYSRGSRSSFTAGTLAPVKMSGRTAARATEVSCFGALEAMRVTGALAAVASLPNALDVEALLPQPEAKTTAARPKQTTE